MTGYILGAQAFVAKEAEATFTPHVDICHATPPDTAANGWVQNSPSIPQLVGHIAQHDADIIPPFGQYPGKNWDAEGQAIYRNGCVVPPPPDVCENIEGLQEETPPNMTNEQGYCDCQEGYHRQYEEEYQEAGDGDSFSCVPDEVPPPVEEPSVVTTTEALAPQCPNNVPVLKLINPHVVRNGSDATVNSFVPEGDRVNIYFRTSGVNGWQHALRDVPVTNGYLSVTIHDLVPTGDYDFGIQASNGCAGGEIVAVIVDSWQPQTFGLTRWERL